MFHQRNKCPSAGRGACCDWGLRLQRSLYQWSRSLQKFKAQTLCQLLLLQLQLMGHRVLNLCVQLLDDAGCNLRHQIGMAQRH